MNHCYRDILDRIHEPPQWFDEQAVPRYSSFTPSEISNIYANECVLLRIGCQNCMQPFDVAMSWYKLDERGPLSERVRNGTIHYGDPPNIECCDSGPSMNSEPLRVLEFWGHDGMHKWVRLPELEVSIQTDWGDNPLEDKPAKFVTQPLQSDRKVQITLDLEEDLSS